MKQHTERDDHFGDLGGALKERAHRTADDDVVVDGQGEQVQQRHYVSRVDQGLPEHVGARLRVAVDSLWENEKKCSYVLRKALVNVAHIMSLLNLLALAEILYIVVSSSMGTFLQRSAKIPAEWQ